MASHKRESEGIALLSIYGDEDDEMEDPEEHQDDICEDEASNAEGESNDIDIDGDRAIAVDPGNDNTPQQLSIENSTPLPMNFGALATPQQSQSSLSSPQQPLLLPQQQLAASDLNSNQKGTLTIVDYGHDEVAMSPEAEEGEITRSGRVMTGRQLQTAHGDFHEKTPPGTVQFLAPSNQATPPLSFEQHDLSQGDAMMDATNQSEYSQVNEAIENSVEDPKVVDPLDKFLPPPPKEKCSGELQIVVGLIYTGVAKIKNSKLPQHIIEKISRFILLKTTGRSFNAEVRNRKEYRNPDFLLHAVTYQDIDQIGSCFSKDVFDPCGYDSSDYYEAIETDMRCDMERKEQERKKSQKVEFISGGTQAATVVPMPRVNMPIPGAGGGLLPVPAAVDAVPQDGSRQNKKSKWMMIEGILCPPEDRILCLLLGHMQHCYQLLMLVLDTLLLPNYDGGKQKKKDLVKSWTDDLEPFFVHLPQELLPPPSSPWWPQQRINVNIHGVSPLDIVGLLLRQYSLYMA